MALSENEIYNAIGEEGFKRLVSAFYHRVKTDDVLSPLYPEQDFPGAEERLRLFLIQRFGGPATYSERRGHPRLRMRHAPFAVTEAARNRWIELMEHALAEANLPDEALPALRKYFLDTATFMINHPPDNPATRLGQRG
jgi:hemoglobin